MRLAILAILLLLPATARAADVAVVPGSPYAIPPRDGVLFVAAAGEANVVTVTRDATTVTVSDAAATVTPGNGCTVDATGHVATCSAANPAVGAFLGDGADSFTGGADFVDGGAGDDDLTGGGGKDALHGGDGADTLHGGDGDDVLEGDGGRDVIDGGAGNDRVTYTGTAGVTVHLDSELTTDGNGAAGENDSISHVEDVDGTDAADTITGSGAGNVLRGNGGDDVLDGKGGHDNLAGGDGTDTIEARDGAVDLVDCDGGSAAVDDVDSVRGCTVTATAVSPAPVTPAPVVIRDPADTTAATLRLAVSHRRHRVRFLVTPNEAVHADYELRRGHTVVAEGNRTIAANATALFSTRRLRRGRLRLRIRLVDGGGNLTRRTVTIRLK